MANLFPSSWHGQRRKTADADADEKDDRQRWRSRSRGRSGGAEGHRSAH